MKGLVTKKHWLMIWKEFGFRKAMKILMSREPVALIELMA